MANKRYDQFQAGSYNASDIILSADPATGELSKIPLSDLPSGAPASALKTFGGIFNVVGGVNTDIFSYAFAANTWANDGDSAILDQVVKSTAGGASKNIRLRFNGNELLAISATTSGTYYIRIIMTRIASGSLIVYINVLRDLSYQTMSSNVVSGLTFSNSITSLTRLESTVNDTITGYLNVINFYSQP